MDLCDAFTICFVDSPKRRRNCLSFLHLCVMYNNKISPRQKGEETDGRVAKDVKGNITL